MLNFPSSPALDEAYTAGGKTWRWNGVAWMPEAASSGGSNPDAMTVAYASGCVSSVTEDGVTTSITYDGQGRVSTMSYPNSGKTRTETYTYNPDGSVAGMTAAEA